MATCEACNTIPAVVVNDYTAKGAWTEVADLKVCKYLPHFVQCPSINNVQM